MEINSIQIQYGKFTRYKLYKLLGMNSLSLTVNFNLPTYLTYTHRHEEVYESPYCSNYYLTPHFINPSFKCTHTHLHARCFCLVVYKCCFNTLYSRWYHMTSYCGIAQCCNSRSMCYQPSSHAVHYTYSTIHTLNTYSNSCSLDWVII